MREYHDLLRRILANGVDKEDRTGTGTRSLFGAQSRYDLRQGFPLMTTKKMFTRGIFEELLWMLRGSTDVRELQDKGVHIWDEWAREDGSLGPVYGAQWRHWNQYMLQHEYDHWEFQRGRDQLAELIQRIKDKPDDRRLIVTAWNPDEVPAMSLPCCHVLFHCWTRELTPEERWNHIKDTADLPKRFGVGGNPPSHLWMDAVGAPKRGLSLQLYQRSCDVFLGVPFNIASYALLTHMIAKVCGMIALDFIHCYGDVHIYRNHMEQVQEQLSREPKPLPRLVLNPAIKDIDAFTIDDIKVEGYECWPAIKAPVAV